MQPPSLDRQKEFIVDNTFLLSPQNKWEMIKIVQAACEEAGVDAEFFVFDVGTENKPEVDIDLDLLGERFPEALLSIYMLSKRRRDELSKPRIE